MTIQTIPINPYANQTLKVILSNQACTINIRQKSTGVYLDLLIDGVEIVTGQLCLNKVPVIQSDYRGFIGSIYFEDIQGNEHPDYTGFNTRYLLRYSNE